MSPKPRSEQPLSPFSVDDAAALAGPAWLRDLRTAAAETFLAGPLPTDALEEWRYSRVDSLDPESYTPARREPEVPPEPLGSAAEALVRSLGAESVLIETRNGFLASSLQSVPELDVAGVEIETLSDEAAPSVDLRDLNGDGDMFATLNLAFAPDPVRIRVRGRAVKPLVFLHHSNGDGLAVFPRLRVELDPGAEALVVEVVAGEGANLVVPVTQLDVAEGGRLSYLHVQLLGPEAWQIGLQVSRIGADASITSAAAALGGSYARLKTDSTLHGTGADGRLLALYFGAGSQMHDFRTVQRHAAKRTRSDLLYKGVVANSARSVYSGLIRVEKGAGGSTAFQTNRNLVLHEGAHADSVPNLEIEDNDVRCSHASAVGPVSEDQRFYLESRGVPPGRAERLIALGFLDEVAEALTPAGVAESMRALITAKLATAAQLEASADVATDPGGEPRG